MEELLHMTMDTARLEEIAREAERTLAKKTGTILSLQKDKKIEALLKSRSDVSQFIFLITTIEIQVPLLLLDLRLLFIRLTGFILENNKLTHHDKLSETLFDTVIDLFLLSALITALAKRIVQSGGIKASIVLLHRVTPTLNNVLVNGEWFSFGYEPIFYDVGSF